MSQGAFKPARPPPTTPLGQRGGLGMASPFGLDSAPHTPDEGNVVGVQSNLLRNRLSSSQSELGRVKRDLKTANEKVLQMSLKLNEEKVSKVALTNKYSTVVARVKEFDDRMKEAEEIIKNERQMHRDQQRATDNLRDQLRARQEIIDQQQEAIRKQQMDREEEVKDWKENLVRTSGSADALREKQHQFMDYFRSLLSDSLDRIGEDRESKDAQFTVITSELTSTITEQQQMLQRLTFENEGMKDSLKFLIKEVEEESNALVLTLLRENKEVWAQLNTTRSELARYSDNDKSKLSKHTEGQLQDQIDSLQLENKQLEDKLRKGSAAIRNNMEKTKEHEKTLQQLMDNLQHAESEKVRYQDQATEAVRSNKEMQNKIRVLEIDIQDFSRIRNTLQTEINTHKETMHAKNEEHQSVVVQMRVETDRECSRLSDELKVMTRRMTEVQDDRDRATKELARGAEQMTHLKRSVEEDRNLAVHQLKEELSLSKNMYEREIDDLRRDLNNTTQELSNLQKVADKERLDGTSMRMEFGALSKQVVELRAENQALHDEMKRLMEKNQERTRELDMKRSELLEYEGQLRAITLDHERTVKDKMDEVRRLEEENKKVKSIVKVNQQRIDELDTHRLSMERENRSLALAAGRGGRRSKEELEKDKELLSAENQRILKQYEEVNEQNTRLLGELSRMRDKAGNMQILQDQIQMYQRQLTMMEQQGDELQDAKEVIARTEAELDELRKERDTMQTRLDTILDETSSLNRKEAELDQCVEAADMQIKRLEQQMERASHFTASMPRGTSPTFTDTPGKYY